MLNDGLKYMTLNDRQQGAILLAVPIPHPDDPWGTLSVLRGTVWEAQIMVVSGSVMADAYHGHATPLARLLEREPRHMAMRISDPDGACSLLNSCAMASVACRPGPKLPDCYEAPLDDPSASHMASRVALAWREGRYVVVVVGDGWNLL